jgi:hypothetical protein
VSGARLSHARARNLAPDRQLAEEIASLLARHNEAEERPDGAYDACLALLDDHAADAILHAAREAALQKARRAGPHASA